MRITTGDKKQNTTDKTKRRSKYERGEKDKDATLKYFNIIWNENIIKKISGKYITEEKNQMA